MTECHCRRGPECDYESKINRVPYELVVQQGSESRRGHVLSEEVGCTCCRPNSSKWLIRKVLVRTTVQPTNDKTVTDVARLGLAICHTTVGIGRHCHNNSARVKLANSTYVVRSTETGTNWVHQRLNSLRAMRLC